MSCGMIDFTGGSKLIRRIEQKDKEIFLRLTREFYASDAVLHPVPDAYHTNTFEELMRSNQYAEGYLIESEGVPAGYALIAKTFSHECGGIAIWIEEIYILPEFRSQGLGKEFFDFLESAYGNVACRFRLELEPENEKAQRLYRRLGFEPLEYKQMVKDKNYN